MIFFNKARPTFAGIPEKFKERLISLLPSSPAMPLDISAPLIEDESYWKRCAQQRWHNCVVSNHGHSWKQLFFERCCEEELEVSGEDDNFDLFLLRNTMGHLKLKRKSRDSWSWERCHQLCIFNPFFLKFFGFFFRIMFSNCASANSPLTMISLSFSRLCLI